MQIDFKAVKLIPIASVLAFYKVQVRKRSSKELVCKCPLPSHRVESHKNNNDTFCISLEKNEWYCHSIPCREAGNHRGGDVIDLVCHMDQIDRKKPFPAAKKLAELFALSGKGEGGAAQEPIAPSAAESSTGNKPLTFELKNLDHAHPYILNRGITEETARKFGVGFFPRVGSMKNRVVFPLHENGNLVGYIGRTMLPVTEDNPKWLLPKQFVKSMIFGVEQCPEDDLLILVESPWTVLQLSQDGYHAAALLGRTLTEAQEQHLLPYHAICVEMDDDEPGREANEVIINRLKPGRRMYRALWKG